MSEPPQRLDSLASRRGRGGPSRGRFMPKAVARRTKEERDASSPADKPEPSSTPSGQSRGNHAPLPGRGGRGGRGTRGRGRGRFEPVASAAVGPLAAPSGMRSGSSSRAATPAFETRAPTGSPGFDPRAIRIKSETPGPETEGSMTPEVDDNRIDMAHSEPVDGSLAQYFPVRLEKLEEDGDQVKKEPGLEVEEAAAAAQSGVYMSPQELREKQRVEQDYEAIINEFDIRTSLDDGRAQALEQKLYFVQFPSVMPKVVPKPEAPAEEKQQKTEQTAENSKDSEGDVDTKDGKDANDAASGDKKTPEGDDDKDVIMIDDDQPEPTPQPAAEPTAEPEPVQRGPYPEGLVGKLRLHRSGKLSMTVGNIVMDVSQGTECSFLQDVVCIDEESKRAFLVGQVSRKLVASPNVDQLVGTS
uniref:ARAD1C16566p n=1 Tax=Blastobotrys adeninivorans TaxID=409370 RepID=A0A060T6V2_BLAAD